MHMVCILPFSDRAMKPGDFETACMHVLLPAVVARQNGKCLCEADTIRPPIMHSS
jgi:hypothetical protein